MADALTTHNSAGCEPCEAQADTELDRQFPRCEFRGNARATIYPPSGDTSQPVCCTVLTRDLSNRGFGIAHNKPLRPQQRVELETDKKRLAGEVLWCREIRPEFFIIGCRLISSP